MCGVVWDLRVICCVGCSIFVVWCFCVCGIAWGLLCVCGVVFVLGCLCNIVCGL